MTETSEYVVTLDNKVLYRKISEHEVDIKDSIAVAFQQEANVAVMNLINLAEVGMEDYGSVSCRFTTSGKSFASIRINKLSMNCPFMLKNEILSPDFTGKEQPMNLKWIPPSSMRLMLGIAIDCTESGTYRSEKHYLIAYDTGGRTWRVPVSNLYEHCELCHGQGTSQSRVMMDVVIQCLKMFSSSQWQSDLSSHSPPEATAAMFRFKPTNEGFVQTNVTDLEAVWSKYCKKVSNEIVNTNMKVI